MPFKYDSPFEERTRKSNMDLENGNEVGKPLLQSQDEVDTERQQVEDVTVEGEGEDHLQHLLVKHVHFSESLQRALEKKEWDEDHGLNKKDDDDDDKEEEEDGTWDEFWEWVKAETKCYANYICPAVLVNACILVLVIVYFSTGKN